jgi:putative transcriptional regulator
MTHSRQARGRWAGLALVSVAAALAGLVPARVEPQPIRSLAGDLLVASEDMRDPRFARTVIYIGRHDAEGAQGFILNRPGRDVPLGRLLDQMGMNPAGASGVIRLHFGGPVDALRVFVLHTSDYTSEGTIPIKDGISVTVEPDILRAIADGKGPRRMLFAVGYAGWGAGQLEHELAAGAWVKAAADPEILFDTNYDTKWERAMARRKIDL